MGVIDDTIDCGLAHDGAQGPERAAAHPLPPSLGALLLAAAPCLRRAVGPPAQAAGGAGVAPLAPTSDAQVLRSEERCTRDTRQCELAGKSR